MAARFAAMLLLGFLGCTGSFEVNLKPPPGTPRPPTKPSPACPSPYDICVNETRYAVRGVNYSPQHEESCKETPFYLAPAYDDLLPSGENDAALMAAANVNTVRIYSPLSKAIASDDCRPDGRCWFSTRLLDALDASGLRLIITVSSVWDFRDGLHLGVAQRYADHPAVLALQIGNEQNYNDFYEWGGRSATELVSLSNAWATEARDAGWRKPVILGWGNPAEADREALKRSNADVVAYQIYERLTLRTSTGEDVFAFHRHTFAGALARPGIVTEYGADARNGEATDLEAQAFAVGNLAQLIADDHAKPNGIAGGVVFSWVDNWGKADGGDPCVQDAIGKPGGDAGPHRDGIFHEEWWGLLTRGRKPRPAYYRLRQVYGA